MGSNLAALPSNDEGELGPAMQALNTDRQRAFVVALVNKGGRSDKFVTAYLEAGYSPTQSERGLYQNAYNLAHDERVITAIREVSLSRMGAAALAASSYLVEILQSDDTNIKPSLKMKAAAMILNRTGLHETTEHKVTVEKKLSETEKVERAIALASKLGLDPKELLGRVGVSIDPNEDIEEAEAVLVGTTAGLEDLL